MIGGYLEKILFTQFPVRDYLSRNNLALNSEDVQINIPRSFPEHKEQTRSIKRQA